VVEVATLYIIFIDKIRLVFFTKRLMLLDTNKNEKVLLLELMLLVLLMK